ncbi:phosphatase PAP2 family protein [Microlunatus elymi]|uniref:Phosphatase PAP2 family protein n=1 Tax=Microlunatus elymi TaxID=2596828 RepID=A0A516PUH9_9ACTN|nr:phosphatase PAP2 family protein [Microlunatus elymi]QDP94856.1 phosphatase PAP2 family protein [Microlunatus elymi]
MSLTTERPMAAQQGGYQQPRPRKLSWNLRSAMPVFVVAVLGVLATTWVALYTTRGQLYDQTAMRVLDSGNGSTANAHLVQLLQQVSVGGTAIALAIMAGVAVLRGRFRLALAAGVLVVGANVTTQLLKRYVLERPDLGQGAVNSLPSGHTTVVFSLVLAAVLVSPRALRWLVVLIGSAVGGLTGLATVIAGWHRPSDVVAGLLVTLAWAALVSGLLTGGPRDGRIGHSGMFAALLGGALAALGVIIYGFGWSAAADASKVIPFTAAVIAGVAALAVGGYAQLVSRTSN